jgi:hypothetical protein
MLCRKGRIVTPSPSHFRFMLLCGNDPPERRCFWIAAALTERMIQYVRTSARFLIAWLATAAIAAAAMPAAHAEDAAQFEAVREADLLLARIGWRLATANAPLCDQLEPGLGLQLHTLDQFDAADRAAAKTHFGFASEVAIEGVVVGSPAAQAGLRADDSLVRVGSVEIAELKGRAGTTDRLVAAQTAIAALDPAAPIQIDLLRKGQAVHLSVQPIPACRSRFELKLTSAYSASADGSMVQIGAPLLQTYSEEQAAVPIAHELAHNILRHRARLEARGVDFGMLSGFGGNVKYFRQTELQADLLGIYLVANAGYSPRAAISFWKHFGPSKAGGILRSRSHPAWRDRIATLEAEIAKIDAVSTRPIVPEILGERERPLSGDWQSLLIRH